MSNSKESLPIAFGVTSGFKGRARTPVYFVTEISEEGVVITLSNEFPSWQAATAAAKEKAFNSDDAIYMIADQIKAFQKRLIREEM